jgi:hypothetical protein
MQTQTDNNAKFIGYMQRTTEDRSHHPGYQSLSERSWWCDGCLTECHRLHDLNAAAEARWYDFFDWLGGLLVKGFAGLLSALFAIVAYFLGGIDYDQSPTTDHEAKWELELQWLMVRRHRLLLGIDRCKGDQSKAYFDGGLPGDEELQRSIGNLECDLLETMVKIESLEEKLCVERVQSAPESFMPHDFTAR